VEALLAHELLHLLRRARVHGAAEDERLSVAKMLGELSQHLVEEREVGIEMLVDRRADDDDHEVSGSERGRSRADLERLAENVAELVFGTLFAEGHFAGADRFDRALVDVVDVDVVIVREDDAERQPDMAAASDDDDVLAFEVRHGDALARNAVKSRLP